MQTTKKGFTLFEILLMVIIISIGILAIVVALNNGLSFIQKTREKTIAINLAREGMEAVYQIRDTNRQRRGGKKEECWLKTNPLKLGGSDCSQDEWMNTGYYIVSGATIQGQDYFLLSGINSAGGINLTDGIDNNDRQFSLCQTTGTNIRYACPGVDSATKEGRYFRQIIGLGLFEKDTTSTAGGTQITNCSNGSSATICGSGNIPKEYRFCSEVQYIGRGQGKVALCGLLTNFQKK